MLWWLSSIRIPKSNGSQAIKRWLRSVRIFNNITFGICGCGNKEKIDSNEEFSAEGISEIVLDISSWNLKVMASSDDKVHIACEGKVEDERDMQVV